MWVSPVSTISRGGRHNPFESTDADRGVKQEEVVRVFCCGAASFPVGVSKAGGEGEKSIDRSIRSSSSFNNLKLKCAFQKL
jgi:hypothetical protein